jgi:transcriptional regulator GlxA family with amidase domain
MRIAVLTFDGFNELDSFIASAMLNRVKRPGWKAEIVSPSPVVVSGNGVRVERQQPLEFAREADVVLVGSGSKTLEVVADPAIMRALRLDPARQLIGAQCSGALVLAKLGLLKGQPACTDTMTRPYAIAAGLTVLEQPFHAAGNVATSGGCLGSHYLAAWVIARAAGRDEAEAVVHYVAPIGEKDAWTARAMAAVGPYLEPLLEQGNLQQESGGTSRRSA